MAGPRILHAPADVGGHAYGLSRGERALGFDSDVAVLTAGPYGYGADIRLDLTDLPTWQAIRRRAGFARHALARYDVIHLNFGHPIVALRRGPFMLSELPALKRAGKTVIVTFQGCDVRPQAACACTSPVCAAQDPKRLPNARHMLRHADHVYHLNPDLRSLASGQSLPAVCERRRARDRAVAVRRSATSSSWRTARRTARSRAPSTSSPRSTRCAARGWRCAWIWWRA